MAVFSFATFADGVPRGSVIGPLLLLLYAASSRGVRYHHFVSTHWYADDTQVYMYISAPMGETQQAAARFVECIEWHECLDQWMIENRLKLNAEKTQLFWFGTRQKLAKLTISRLTLVTTASSSMVDVVSIASNLILGVTFNGPLTTISHISSVTRRVSSSYASCGLSVGL